MPHHFTPTIIELNELESRKTVFLFSQALNDSILMNFVIQLQTTVVELNTYRDPQKKLKWKFLTLIIFNTVVTGFEAFL